VTVINASIAVRAVLSCDTPAADRRVDAIRADQEVRVRLPAVGEVQPQPVRARLVAGA
jgi:hypothetical protein